MNREFLGDSYDCVKRLWRELLQTTAPLFAEGQFILKELRQDYTRFTGIPILAATPPAEPYSILNDPDTGIRLPNGQTQKNGKAHILLETINQQLKRPDVFCVITFDQTHYRRDHGNLKEQHDQKMRHLQDNRRWFFYYNSHASFLFAFPSEDKFKTMRNILINAGIPDSRIVICVPNVAGDER